MNAFASFFKNLPRAFAAHAEPEQLRAVLRVSWQLVVGLSIVSYALVIGWGAFTLAYVFSVTTPTSTTLKLPPPTLDRQVLFDTLGTIRARAAVGEVPALQKSADPSSSF